MQQQDLDSKDEVTRTAGLDQPPERAQRERIAHEEQCILEDDVAGRCALRCLCPCPAQARNCGSRRTFRTPQGCGAL